MNRQVRLDRIPAADWSTPAARAANHRTIGERWLSFAHSIEAANPARAERLMIIGRAHLQEAAAEHAAANRKRNSHGQTRARAR